MNEIIIAADSASYALGVIDRANLAESTKRQYKRVIRDYTGEGLALLNAADLRSYANRSANSRRSFLKAVVNRLAEDVKQHARQSIPPDQATPENMAQVQAMVNQAIAVKSAIETKEQKGQKPHTWLTSREVKELLIACGERPSGRPEFDIIAQRDRLAIGLLAAAGLRRREACNLTFKDVLDIPNGEGGKRTSLDILGKGDKSREVPVSARLAAAIREWGETVGAEGRVLRSLGRNKIPGESLSTTSLYNIVQKRGALIGKPELQPHDLRRTYAQIGYENDIQLPQLQALLGHSDLATTRKYLNIELDRAITVSDFVPF